MLPAVCKHVVLAPAALVLVCVVVCVLLNGYEDFPGAGAGIVDSGVVNLPAAEPLARHDNFAAVPVQVAAVLLLSLLAECRHVVLAPAALALVCVAVRVLLNGCEDLPCAGAGIVDSGAVNLPAAESLAQRNNSAAVLVTQSAMPPLLLPLAERRHVVPAPAVLGSMWCAVAWCPVWIALLPRVAVVGLMFGAVAQAALAVTAPWILYSASDGKSCAGAGQLHGRFHGQSFLPARLRYALRCPNGRAASRCHSAPSRIFAPSGAGQ